jgi:peptide/nickel transport system substrate-binding protein
MHAIDRPALAEAMVEDRGMAADTMVPPIVGYYSEIDRIVTKYPNDLRRAEQLMGEVGYTKGPDGIFVSPTAGRFSQELGGLSEGQEAQDTTIVGDYLKRAGFDTRLDLIPAALRSGPEADEMTATFSGLNTNNNSLTPPLLGMHKFTSANIGSAENRWRGTNKMGWWTPAYDRLSDAFNSTLDTKEAEGLMVQMVKLVNDELPTIPLYFNFSVMAHVGSLRGPEAATPSSTIYYNIHQWEWR